MKIYYLSFLIILFGTPQNECLQGYREDAKYDFEKGKYEEAITTYQEAIQNCPLSKEERRDVLEELSSIYDIINQTIEEKRKVADRERNIAKKAKDIAETNEKRAVREALQSEARRLASLADREKKDRKLKLKLAYEAMLLMDSSKTQLSNVLLAFGDAVRDSFLTIQPLQNKVINDFLVLNDLIVLAQGKELFFYGEDTSFTVLAHDSYIASLNVFNNKIVSSSRDGNLKFWSKNGTLLNSSKEHSGKINFIAIDFQNKQLLTGATDSMAYVWDNNAKIIAKRKHFSKIVKGDFTKDGKYLLTRTQNKIIHLWGNDISTEIEANSYIYDAVFLDNGGAIVVADADGNVKKYNKYGQLSSHYQEVDNPAISLHTNSTEQYYIAVFASGNAILGEVKTNNIQQFDSVSNALKPPIEQFIPFEQVMFSPVDASFIISSRNEVQHIDLDGNILSSFQQAFLVMLAKFSRDGESILTTATDFSIKVHRNGQRLLDINNLQSPVLNAEFSQDGHRIVAYTKAGNLIICQHPDIIFEQLKNKPPVWTKEELKQYELEHLKN